MDEREAYLDPTILERIVAWALHRLPSGRWRLDGSERLYALQVLRWSLYLEIGGAPGLMWDHYSWCGLDDPELPAQVIGELIEKGYVVRRSDRLFSADRMPADEEEKLWDWLDRHTPDGFPPRW